MSYSTEKAALIAEQLRRLATQHPHQLAGQLTNLEFWMGEAAAAIAVIQDYPARFRKLRDAQVAWVSSRDVKLPYYCPVCQGACEFGPRTPNAPHRISSKEMDAARDDVRRSAAQLLLRLYRSGLLASSELGRYASDLELPIEPDDLRGEG